MGAEDGEAVGAEAAAEEEGAFRAADFLGVEEVQAEEARVEAGEL